MIARYALRSSADADAGTVWSTKYSISKERDGFAVCVAKTGKILVTFERRDQAEDYRTAQVRADEQARVLRAFNEAQEVRCLAAEFLAEFA